MVKEKYSDRKHIETHKKPESNKKIELHISLQSDKDKLQLRFLQKKVPYENGSKKCHIVFKYFFIFIEFLSNLVSIPDFKSINSSSLSKKRLVGWFDLHPYQQF